MAATTDAGVYGRSLGVSANKSPFSRLPGCEGLDAGVRELRARILRRFEAGQLGRP